MAARHFALHRLAHEVVIHDFMQGVRAGRGRAKRHIQVDVETHALRRGALEVVDANRHLLFEPLQEQPPALQQELVRANARRIIGHGEGRRHGWTGSVRLTRS
ncbi:hypothetical protein D3C71_1778850 [compost metagenome]